MNERQRKKTLNKKKTATLNESHYIANVNITSLQNQLSMIHNEIVNRKNESQNLVPQLHNSNEKYFEYLKPIIIENRFLANSLDEATTYRKNFDAVKSQVYTLEKQIYEIQIELEKEKERTFKTKNSLSFLLGNALIMYSKNNESILSLIRKLITLRKLAKERRAQPKIKATPLMIPDLLSSFTQHNSFIPQTKIIPNLSANEYVLLNKQPYWFSYTPRNEDELSFTFSLHSSEKINYKDILARIKIITTEGKEIDGNLPGTYMSSTVGRYIYLNVSDDSTSVNLKFTPPTSTGTILIGLQTWSAKKEIKVSNEFKLNDNTSLATDVIYENEAFQSLKDGISVIIPSYKGENTIIDMLQSISDQTLPKELMQVIIVINGNDIQSIPLFERFKVENPDIEVVIHHESMPSASNARNVGIDFANRKYSLFLDNDDFLTENYMQALYNKRAANAIAIAGIHDLNDQGEIIKNNNANNQYISSTRKPSITYNDITAITTMIACKLLPTHNLKQIRFIDHLRSGEDVVFFCEYLSRFKPIIKTTLESENAFYIRRITQNSVSRQQSTFDFCVRQRLQVIKELRLSLAETKDKELSNFISSKINAQCIFIRNYLSNHPDHKQNMLQELKKLSLEDFSYEVINRGKAKALVISYCFPPFVDTSACVMAKRIRKKGLIVDVIHNDMSKVRQTSNDLNLLVSDLIEQRKLINTPSTFANWSGIYAFALESLKWASRKQAHYESIYSRAMWPASHFAAFLIKKSNPTVKWTAEFSDPILWDIQSQQRYEKINLDFIKNNAFGKEKIIDALILKNIDNDNLYFWCETLPYLFSDEIIFTCTNQRDYMLSKIQDEDIRKLAFEKSIISHHPTLDDFYYTLGNNTYPINSHVKNIGYFGAFYSKRNLNDVLQALKKYNASGNKGLILHVFTEQENDAVSFVKECGLSDVIKVNGYLSYLDFLSIIKNFDCLIVNDAQVKEQKGINPYLPSKISDYLGAGVPIWSIFEEGSALSKIGGIKYRSRLGSIKDAEDVLHNIVKDNR